MNHSDLPEVHPTVVHMLAAAAARSPAAIALVDGDRSMTYAQYLNAVSRFAHELAAQGARRSRVALVAGNSLEMAVAMFAIHAAGAQCVPINPIYTAREIHHILTDAEPVAVVCGDDVPELVGEQVTALGLPLITVGRATRRLDQGTRPAELPPLPHPDDLATLQYTGGTTGVPKGVNISHRQLAVNISQREAALPTRPDDEVILCVMPLFHVFAVAMCLHLACYCRGTLLIHPRYRPDWVLEALSRQRVTRLPAGPTVFIGLMGHEDFAKTDFSRLRCCYSGSAPLPAETLERWRRITGTTILEGFGQTEAGPVLTYVREGGTVKPGSAGPVLPLTELQIVDTETGRRVLGLGERGEIRARGPQIMSGYRNRPEETAEALRDGWLYTGDIGELDEDGYLWVRDRKKDMVIVGGYNVYPREIEEVLHAHPAVREAAAIGVADSYRGEVVRAYVVASPDSGVSAETLLAYCCDNLAKYKVPTAIELVDQIPKTTVGKINKAALRQMAVIATSSGRPIPG
jgi:long-chain acyl-CoA synthetase